MAFFTKDLVMKILDKVTEFYMIQIKMKFTTEFGIKTIIMDKEDFIMYPQKSLILKQILNNLIKQKITGSSTKENLKKEK